jgi:hypothetical protein
MDDNRAIATEARVKIAHAAPAAGNVDVYVTPAGEVSDTRILNGEVTPLLSDYAFGVVTDYVSVTPGDYDIRVVAADGTLIAINIADFNLPAGLVATVIARGPSEISDTPDDFGVIVLTN